MNDKKICKECGLEKHYSCFSLQRNKYSQLRKNYCTACDYAKRKRKKKALEVGISVPPPLPDFHIPPCDPIMICKHEFPDLLPLVQSLLERPIE